MLAAGSSYGQMRVTGPSNEILVFDNVSFEPGAANGSGLTRISGTVTNASGEYLANAAIKVQFFDKTSRVYPRPSMTCRFSINGLVPGKSVELGEKKLREMPEHPDAPGRPILQHKPIDCNVFLRSVNISDFSLNIISALHGRHILTTTKPFSRFYRETESNLPWYMLKDETEVEVLEFVPGRDSPYKVKILDEGSIGYVEADKIVVTPEVVALEKTLKKADMDAPVATGKLWIGMTREMARKCCGTPATIDRSLLIEGVHEKWIYESGLYLEFDNGILTGYGQER